MKRFTLTVLTVLLAYSFVYAGGIVTNTNQSTAWTRMLVRDASIDIDAVYYNPAGLTKLKDGFYISINNQSIFQKRTITSSYPYLNSNTFEGTVNAPLFPSVYMAFKTGRWAFSVGVMPIGGGGSATFENGLASMETPIAGLAHQFAPYGVTGYSSDIYFDGSSIYWGIQGGITFEITKNISIYAGVRYNMASNTYEGHMKDVTFKTAAGDIRTDAFMLQVAQQAEDGSQQANYVGEQMQPLIDYGMGDKTIEELVAGGIITPDQGEQIAGGLIQLGYPPDAVNAMPVSQIQTTYFGAAETLHQQSQELTAGSTLFNDQEVDVKQTGNGITPIIGLDLSFLEDDLIFAFKYEFKTNMDVVNETVPGKGFNIGIDPATGQPIEMFPDGDTTNADIPAMLSIGVRYKITDKVNVQGGYHTYFDSKAGWATTDDGTELIDHNYTEYAVGAEWNVSQKFLLSAGYLATITGVNDKYQSDLGYSLSTTTFGLGAAFAFSPAVKLQLGGFYTMYNGGTYTKTDNNFDPPVVYGETYDKSTWGISLGLDIAIISKKKNK